MAGTASIVVRGNVTEAIAALESLGIKAEAVGLKSESAFGKMAQNTGGVFQKLGSTLGSFGLPFSESVSKVGDKFAETETKGKNAFANLASVGKGMALGVAAGAAAVGYESIEMADKLEASRAKLEGALKGAGTSFEALKGPIAGVDLKMEHLGYTNAQTEDALAALTVATQNPKRAMSEMGLVADLARFKNISLTDASIALAKAQEGNLRPLKQLGIDLPVAASSAEKVKVAQENLAKAIAASNAVVDKYGQGVMDAGNKHNPAYAKSIQTVETAQKKLSDVQSTGGTILDALNQRIGGQSTEYTKTFAGKMDVLRATTQDLGAKLGLILIPILEKLGTILAVTIGWFEKHKTVAMLLGAVIGGALVVAIGAYIASVVTAEAVTAAFGAVMTALPWIAIVAGLILLLTHWKLVWGEVKKIAEDVWKFLDGVWQGIDKGIREAWGKIEKFFKDWWPLLIGIFTGPIGLLVGLIIKFHSQISDVIQTMWHAVAGFFQRMWDDVEHATGTAIALLVMGFKALVDGAFKMVEGVLSAASHLPFVGSHFAAALKTVKGFQSDVDSSLSGLANDMRSWGTTAGQNLGQGMAAGISQAKVAAIAAGAQLSADTVKSMRLAAQTASPSKLTFETGIDIAKGLEQGMMVGRPGAQAAATSLVSPSTLRPAPAVAAAGGTVGGTGDGTPVILQIDGRTFATGFIPYLRTKGLQDQKKNATRFGWS